MPERTGNFCTSKAYPFSDWYSPSGFNSCGKLELKVKGTRDLNWLSCEYQLTSPHPHKLALNLTTRAFFTQRRMVELAFAFSMAEVWCLRRTCIAPSSLKSASPQAVLRAKGEQS